MITLRTGAAVGLWLITVRTGAAAGVGEAVAAPTQDAATAGTGQDAARPGGWHADSASQQQP